MGKPDVFTNPPLVLIVDDEATLRLLAHTALAKAGFEVAEAVDGLQGVALFERLQPDLVLLDVLMPRLDGFEACRLMRQVSKNPHTPIVMLTGLEDLDSIHRAYEVGATDFITKPINWTILGARARYMIRASREFMGRQKLENQLHQSQKMETIGQLASGVARDFNNFLIVVNGYTDLILDRLPECDPIRMDVKEIKKAAEQAISITQQLLAFGRKQILQPQPVNLNEILLNMHNMLPVTTPLHGSETIFLVEYEDMVRQITSRILQNFGYKVLAAPNAPQALAMGKEHGEPVCILLTDIIMPEMSGKELAEKWLASHPETKVIYMSGYTENIIVKHGNLQDGGMFIQKPFQSEALARKIREALDSSGSAGGSLKSGSLDNQETLAKDRHAH